MRTRVVDLAIGSADGLTTRLMQGSRLGNMKKRILTNVDSDGCAVCIKSNYFKMGSKNFQPQVGGGNTQPQESWR